MAATTRGRDGRLLAELVAIPTENPPGKNYRALPISLKIG